MQNKFYFLIFLIPFLIGCTNDDFILTDEIQSQNKSAQITTITPEVKAITKYMARTHGVKSRSSVNNLTPFVLDGDTVMYISNYDEGWEVFSNDPRVPMVLMKSEKGNFYPTDLNDNTPFEGLFKNTAEYLSMIKKSEIEPTDTINSEWMACGLSTLGNDWENDGSGTGNNSYYWKLVGVTMPEYRYELLEPIGGRLKTKWHQKYPFNWYTPYKSENHTMVGCVAVALGQYLYFTHYKDNCPVYAVTDAHYNSSTNKYTFSGASSSIWDSFKTVDDERFDFASFMPTAIFLSWIGHNINMAYGLESSGSSLLNKIVLDFFNSQTQLNASAEKYTKKYVIELLSKGYPVIIQAEYSNSNNGHAWLIDHYESEICTYSEYYIYVNDPLDPAPNPDEEENEEDDLWSHPSVERIREVYGDVNIDIKYYSSNKSFYKFNWGDELNSYEVKYDANIVSWLYLGSDLNKNAYIYYFK
ncbi:MAG: C10 family peptidase [Muribaculaceae bacterium]|nr:C10 family peptidase [Muribaculaceae bacterium]